MLSDDEVYDLSDTFDIKKQVVWPDLAEGRQYFSERTISWWAQHFGHPRTGRGFCATCGRGGSCLWDTMVEGLVMATIAALAETGQLHSLDNQDCPRCDEQEEHSQHVYRSERDSRWYVCDGWEIPTHTYWTKPWAKGLEIHVEGCGTTQTHYDYPEDTVEKMVRSLVSLTYDVGEDGFHIREVPAPEEEA